MKKILLGLTAALALVAFTHVARAEGDAAGGDKPADSAPAKKGKKGKKGKKAAAEGDAAGGAAGDDATKK